MDPYCDRCKRRYLKANKRDHEAPCNVNDCGEDHSMCEHFEILRARPL